MAPRLRGGHGDPLGRLGQAHVNLVAGKRACSSSLGQADPGSHQQRLHARDGGVHRGGDLLVGQRVDLTHQQRAALCLGQLADVAHDFADLRALVRDVLARDAARSLEHVHRVVAVRFDGAPEVVEAAVARDAVEPSPRDDRSVVGEHRAVRRDEGLLQYVLGVLGRADHVATEGEQARLVAAEESFERARVAAAHEPHQLLVALQAQQRRSGEERRRTSGGGAE